MEERRYWRPEAERLLEEIGKVPHWELMRHLTWPTVISLTEERILDEMIKPVDFSEQYTATASSTAKVDVALIRQMVEQMRREMGLVEAENQLRKIIEASMTGIYEVVELKLDESDLQQKRNNMAMRTVFFPHA